MAPVDIAKTNEAARRLLEVTTNPRHRFFLAAYDRHRNLEMAGRHAEIFVPEMTVEHPVYHFNVFGMSMTWMAGNRSRLSTISGPRPASACSTPNTRSRPSETT
jgi:hypothetical protein